jgi:hypothetical protein
VYPWTVESTARKVTAPESSQPLKCDMVPFESSSPSLTNAVSSIELAVEDLESADARRILSCARNVTGGVLLLFRERLRQVTPVESPALTTAKQIVATQQQERSKHRYRPLANWRRTANLPEMCERLGSLGVIADWQRLARIVNSRDDIEHCRLAKPTSRLLELVGDSCAVMRDFVTTELRRDPAKLFGKKTWQSLTEAAQRHSKELAQHRATHAIFDWKSLRLERVSKYFRCFECGSELVSLPGGTIYFIHEEEFHCSACGMLALLSELIEPAVSDCFGASVEGCDQCGLIAFSRDEKRCIACDAGI